MIYLVGKAHFEGVQNLVLNEICFFDFSLDLSEFEALIITSKNAIKALKRLHIKAIEDLNVYAVGAKTAKTALDYGFKEVKFPQKAYASELVAEFKEELKGKKCLYLRAKQVRSNLSQELLDLGVYLSECIAYENKPLKPDISLIQPAIFIFNAHSVLENFLSFYSFNEKDNIICLGQSTAKALPKGLKNKIYISQEQSLEACVSLAKSLLKQE
nr:uroporphyrinogen-III synthase [Campylobacter sp. MIT 19-121]